MSSDESRLREAVTAILEAGDLQELTEKKVRQLARERTGIDTSAEDNKKLIHKIVKAFVEEEAEDPIGKKRKKRRKGSDEEGGSEKEEEEDEEEEEGRRGKSSKGGKKWKVGDNGELVICELSAKRKVTVSEFKGRLLVSIREYWSKDGKELPSSKGISLPPDQWEKLVKHIDVVQEAIQHMS
ncbi:hypothetical protein CLOP_g11869 [Closterium sp. NIES-67]|nr:hypothetical protein CLOP_g11869 [Closterium sp. NIES-67]